MERQEKIKRRDEVRALFEGKVYEGEFILEASMSIDGDIVYLCDIHMHDLTDFPYSEKEEFAKKCYKEFPKNFGLSVSDNLRKSIDQTGMCRYLSVFNDPILEEVTVTLEEVEAEFKRRVKELL
jgi:hypothetical protein